jgi:hypothetical protein
LEQTMQALKARLREMDQRMFATRRFAREISKPGTNQARVNRMAERIAVASTPSLAYSMVS